MSGVIEAIHIFDERHSPILSHTYTGRPLSATQLLPLYLDHPAPRPSLIYLPNTNPQTLVFSLTHENLLLLLTASSEVEPLLALEFLHRVVDVLEDFLGGPVLPHKIESSYDVVAQLLTEMCDAGTVATTEPNALRDMVEVEGFMGKLLGNLNLPGKSQFNPNSSAPNLAASTTTPALPWRRANVRHTSNEMYADVIETLTVTLAPSGRPLAAFANGSVAFTCKVSGVPDILLTLTGPSGRHNLGSVMELPVFHPCVRLARWKERPGELSFVPPDGRFLLAGYEVDLMPSYDGKGAGYGANKNLKLPVGVEVKTGLGPLGSDFEVRLNVNKAFGAGAGAGGGSSGLGGYGRGGASGVGRGFGSPQPGTQASPALEDVRVTVPLPEGVRNLTEMRPSKGDVAYSPGDRSLEWHIGSKELAAGGSYYGLRCTVVGHQADEEEERDGNDASGFGLGGVSEYSYDEPYQSTEAAKKREEDKDGDKDKDKDRTTEEEREGRKTAQNKILMPSSAAVSFSVKGWLASGIKIESIVVDPRKSRGLSEGMKPYKGVKYLTVSKGGVEIRC